MNDLLEGYEVATSALQGAQGVKEGMFENGWQYKSALSMTSSSCTLHVWLTSLSQGAAQHQPTGRVDGLNGLPGTKQRSAEAKL